MVVEEELSVTDTEGETDLFPLVLFPLPFPLGLSDVVLSVISTSKTISLTLRENLVLLGGVSKTKVQQKHPEALYPRIGTQGRDVAL